MAALSFSASPNLDRVLFTHQKIHRTLSLIFGGCVSSKPVSRRDRYESIGDQQLDFVVMDQRVRALLGRRL